MCDCGDGVFEVRDRQACIGCEWRWYGRVKVVMGAVVFVVVKRALASIAAAV